MPNAKPDVHAVFNEAIARESDDERRRFIDEACRTDATAKRRVEALLQAHSQAGDFMGGKSPANAATPEGCVAAQQSNAATPEGYVAAHPSRAATLDMPAIPEPPGTQIGPYKLREQIGEGGFGVVYVAEQTQPVRRKVALKIIKPGMDTKDVIARFEAERQALALMEHPNIAKVLDAGTTGEPCGVSISGEPRGVSPRSQASNDLRGLTPPGSPGRPYFVMELVKGVAITNFCDEQTLDTRERLQLFIDVCRAVQHAHQKGIIHRDLKPSNVMVTLADGKPVPKVIDFGVSKALSRQLTEHSIYTAYGQMVGTPLYMAPEQAEMSMHDVDTRSDVYSLGVLLYELLTGTTPFDKETLKKAGFDELRRIIREDEPPRPSARVSTLNAEALSTVSDKHRIDPRKLGQSYRGELDWIVMKSLEKDRNRRYESANAFAADVERYLNDEPVQARPQSRWYQFRKFARRHKTLFGTTALVAAVLIAGIIGTTWQAVRATTAEGLARNEASRAIEAETTATAAALRADNEAAGARFQAAVLKLRQFRRSKRGGWRTDAWELVRKAAAIRKDATIRDEAAATLIGLDAQPSMQFKFGGSSVTFDARGKRLLVGGIQTKAGGGNVKATRGASVWKEGVLEPKATPYIGPGPVAFDANGRPLQLAATETNAFQLVDVEQPGRIRRFQFQPPADKRGGKFAVALNDLNLPICALSRHAARITGAAVSVDKDGTPTNAGLIAVWDGKTGKRLLQVTESATAVALSPDGALLAVGKNDGRILLWSVSARRQFATLKRARHTIHALAFHRDVRRSWLEREGDTSKTWLLAAGDGAGRITIWDVAAKIQRSYCFGSLHAVYSVAFSPDGMTLASAGRGETRLWDVATGRQLLRFAAANYIADVSFSPDGSKLAVCSLKMYPKDDGVVVWNLEFGQGIHTLRGLAGNGAKAVMGADGKLIAGLSNEWNVGIWDLRKHRLLHVLEVPPGYTVDNAALAFSPDGHEFAFSAGTQATLWDIRTGRHLKTWKLPPGLQDRLGFHASGKLLLFRYETKSAGKGPFTNNPWNKDPRVCRLRELKPDGEAKAIAEIARFNRHVWAVGGTRDGSVFVVDGVEDKTNGQRRAIAAYVGLTGKELWPKPNVRSYTGSMGHFAIDPKGTLLAANGARQLVDLRSGLKRRVIGSHCSCLGPSRAFFVRVGGGERGAKLHRLGQTTAVLNFAIDNPSDASEAQFTSDGRLLAWPASDGSVFVADLAKVRRRLTQVGLGW